MKIELGPARGDSLENDKHYEASGCQQGADCWPFRAGSSEWKVSMKTDDQPPAKDTFMPGDPHGPVRTGPLLGASSLRTQNV